MKSFAHYLDQYKEVGYVEKVLKSLVYVRGLPTVRSNEVVVFETDELGQVLSLGSKYVEVLLLARSKIHAGLRVARTNEVTEVGVGDSLLGHTVDALGKPFLGSKSLRKITETRAVEVIPFGINRRSAIDSSLETGVSIVDLVVPLGKGQRELVVGDRKTGKTSFLLQTILSQARKGSVCVVATIAKRRFDIAKIEEYFAKTGIKEKTVIVASSSSDPIGLVYLTPYTAMTIAEYFRDQGQDVVVILDDMTTHAKYYREISLLANRFPGRSSYPGDVFYIHSRLMERAGNFLIETSGQKKEVSITCLPVAELVMGDMSGYIQTNLMAMTDGHIFFDIDYYNEGKRPPINPFLSVTRVGRQAQTDLLRDISRQITSFLVRVQKLRQYMHFGAELSEVTKRNLSLGEKIEQFFYQPYDRIIPVNLSAYLIASLWAGYWKEAEVEEMRSDLDKILDSFEADQKFKNEVDQAVASSKNFSSLVDKVRIEGSAISKFVSKPS